MHIHVCHECSPGVKGTFAALVVRPKLGTATPNRNPGSPVSLQTPLDLSGRKLSA